jgi:hypothetical protein
MATSDPMSIDERRKYLSRMAERYRKADRHERGRLLDEMEVVTRMHRKSLTRLLRAGTSLERKPWKGRRKRVYGAATEDVVRVVWESLDYICAERLTPSVLTTARQLATFDEVRLTHEIEEQLASISRATVTRLLSRMRQDVPRLPRRGPEQANRLRAAVPMGRMPWDTTEPGHFETDLVHHCGASAAGEYVHTLQLVDVATGWSERAAAYGRNQQAMSDAFDLVVLRVPFKIKEIHPDNGSEFFNHHLLGYFGSEIATAELSRSRPFHKNDNRFVEQKNDTLVRAYFGKWRIDTRAQCTAMNALYEQMWCYYNLFQPVLRLVEKRFEDGRLRRVWDTATTPFERALRTGAMNSEAVQRLTQLRDATNPRALRRTIEDGIAQLWDLTDENQQSRHAA